MAISCQTKQERITKQFESVFYRGHFYIVHNNTAGDFLHDPNCPCLINQLKKP